MAKNKAELVKEAQAAGLIAEDAGADDFTADQLSALLSGDVPAFEGSLSASEEMVAPDGHVNVSAADIKARQ